MSGREAGAALPNAVIAGAPRCGTTSLFVWLADHPQVGAAAVKETFYLMDATATVKDRGRFHRDGLDGYRAFFSHVPPGTPVTLEATAGYLYQQTALDTFATRLPETKLIFVLRRPAERLLSTYRYFSNNWTDLDPAKVDFETYAAMTRAEDPALAHNDFLRFGFAHGRYVEALTRWRERCGAERMRIILLEDLRSGHQRELSDLASWLGLDASFYETYRFPRRNENYRVRNRPLQRVNRWVRERIPHSQVRERLSRWYRALNTRRPAAPDALETAVLERLDRAYADSAAALADAFGLDLAAWRRPRGDDR